MTSRNSHVTLLLFLLFQNVSRTLSFLPSVPHASNHLLRSFHCQRQVLVRQASSNADPDGTPDMYSEQEIDEMKDLILSLSMEPTDESRRGKVKDVFQEALSRPNGMPKRFTDLFDKVLVEVGDEVQSKAKKQFFEDQAAAETSPDAQPVNGANAEESAEATSPGERIKSPQELQLWALVDMMVQTKTIVKKANGELGSKGTFQ